VAAPAAAPAERTGLVAAAGLQAAARTDRGTVREHNEDAFVCVPERGLFAVIDGMGGQQGGQRAAALAREALLAEDDLVRALGSANQKIHHLAEGDPALRGMGCVASGLRVEGGTAHVVHVGDTRVYLASPTGCEQLTRDHTVAATRQEDFGISHRGAREISGHNQVTRDVGGRAQPDDRWIDRVEVPLEDGALILMCTDGLYGVVPAEELFSRLREARRSGTSPQVLADELVDLALERGTRDNVTAVVVSRQGEPVPGSGPPPVRRRRRVRLGWLAVLVLGAAAGWTARPLVEPPPPPPHVPPVPPVELVTDVPEGTARVMRSASLGMPSGNGRWSIRVGAGSRLTLRDAAIDAPGVSLAVSLLGPDSRLEVVDSRLNLASLAAQGPPGSRVDIRGGDLLVADAAGPRAVGATLEWDGRASPSPKAAEEN
jgi:PPM family protein phosphatase